MAEAIVVVAVVSSIVQLVDFTSKVIARLNDIQSGTKDIPKSLEYLNAELPVLLHTLQQILDAIKADRFPSKCAMALQPAVDGCKASIQDIESILSKTLPNQGDGKAKNFIKAVGSVWNEGKIERITATIHHCIATLTLYFAASASIEHREKSKQLTRDMKVSAIQRWLSAPDPSENHFKALRLREPDTGLWLLESNIYKDWKTRNFFVWLYGIPGCGKTVLSTIVLQDIRKYTAEEPGKATIYFYFDFNDRKKQNAEMMIRSLLSQLLQQDIDTLLSIEALFEFSRSEKPSPPLESLLKALKDSLVQIPVTYVVLDALDECEDRRELMKIIDTIASWKVHGLHILCTSRREGDIAATLERIIETGNVLNIQTKAVDRDIQLYVHRRIADEPALQKWKDDDRKLMEQSLAGGARGMFRLAACRLDILRKCRNRKQLLQAIQNLPPDLDQMYNRILGQIDEADVPYAIRILRWLTFAPRPLYLTEVAEVAGLDPDRCPAFDRDEILQDPSDVLTICSSLVNIADQGKMEYSQSADRDSSMGSCVSTESDIDSDLDTEPVVVLAHYSVKEYLVSERIFDSKAKLWSMNANLCHQTLAKSCVQYLLQMATADLSHYELALADYSVDQWIYHYNSVQNPDPDLQELVVQLFKDKDAFSNMVYFARASGDEMSWPGVGHLPEPLFIACDYGLLDVVQRLVSETDVDINESKRMPTILEVASARGDLSIVRFLLEQGATAKDDALRSASRYGQLQVVRLLVEQGAQINAHGVNCPSALQWASYSGHFGVLQYLVENGAETGNLDEIAICRASLGGHLAIVRIMVENSANTNGSIGRNGHALYCASYGNHLELVKYLVKIGAEVNAKCSGKYGTALLAASARGSFEVVQCLVEGGADINAQCDNEHGGALMAATTIGRLDIVRYLVERGADVNAIGSRQADNALEAASVRGHMNIVQYLVEHGADVNIKTTWPEAPLTSWGDIVQYLIEHRDDTIAAAGNDVS